MVPRTRAPPLYAGSKCQEWRKDVSIEDLWLGVRFTADHCFTLLGSGTFTLQLTVEEMDLFLLPVLKLPFFDGKAGIH
jgi:hypothetical protein